MEKQSLRIVLGRDAQGGDIAFDLATLPHLLIGGSTGSGRATICVEMDGDHVMAGVPGYAEGVIII